MFEKWGTVDITKVKSKDISEYLSWLRTDYVPKRYNGKTHPLSPKTIRNVWIVMSAFFSWASREYDFDNPMKDVPPPRFQKVPVAIFTQEDIRALLKACMYSRKAEISDVDVKHGRLDIQNGVGGGAKGGKGRTINVSKVTRQALWRYLQDRDDIDGDGSEAPLFVVSGIRRFNAGTLRQLIKRIGNRAGVLNVYPHKFRHTFALTYLRAGGDVFKLQALLGHSSLDMVRYYAQIAQVDVEKAHRKASPVDNWRL